MANNVLEILKTSKALVDYHIKTAAMNDIVGENPSTMAGAENDGTIDATSLSNAADATVKDRITPEPDGARKPGGEGDDSPLTRGQATDSTQAPPEKPVAEPLDATNANADRPSEKAAGLCNGILADIKRYQEQQKTAEAKLEPVVDTEAKEPVKEATPVDSIELNQDVLAKIASVLLSTQEGWDFAEAQLSKVAGAEDAKQIMGHVEAEEEKAASYYEGMATAVNSMTANKIDALVKAGQLAPEEAMPLMEQEAITPEDAAALDSGEGEGIEEAAEGMGDVNPEEIIEAIAEAVESGEMDESEGLAIAESLVEAAGGGEGGEIAPEVEEPMEDTMEESKMASAIEKKAALKSELIKIAEEKRAYDKGMSDAIETVKTAQEADAAIADEMAGVEGDVNPEEVIEALSEAVDSGEIDEDTAVALVEELVGGGEGDMGPEGSDELTPDMAEGALGDMIDEGDLTPKLASAVFKKLYAPKN